MKTLRTQRQVTLVHPVNPAHPNECIIRYTDTGDSRLLDVSLLDFETEDERRMALGEAKPKAFFIIRYRTPGNLRTRSRAQPPTRQS